MTDVILRFAILLLIGILTLAFIFLGRRIVIENRRQALRAEPFTPISVSKDRNEASGKDIFFQENQLTPVRILEFGSEDCAQCHQLQQPVLRRVVEAKGDDIVTVIHIDAPTSPELTARYHVLTVPTTVLLDKTGKVHSVNYGFTNAQSLIKQVDEIVNISGAQKALS